MKFFTFFFSACILLFTGSHYMFGQVPPLIEQEEAPATVWDMQIGDSDVDLYIAGYWKIGIMGGASIESGPDGIVFPAAFPGLTDFKFYQEPDLTISLWLMNRYYLETSFLEGFDKNTYAVGYRGMEGETVQSVRIGNSDITIDDYKGINVPAPKYNTPGISAAFQTDLSTHDLLIRYDPTSEYKKIFLGEYEVTEEVLEVGAYQRGRHFILPDSGIDFIEVYVPDEKGLYSGDNGKSYSLAEEGDYSYSLSSGTVSFDEIAATEILIYYEKGSLSVGSNTLGRDFITPLVNGEPDPAGTPLDFAWSETDSWHTGTYEEGYAVSVNGRKTLRVYNSGKFGPFELMNHYKVATKVPEEQWRSEIFLADNSNLEADDSDDYEYRLDSEAGILTLYNETDKDHRSSWSRYPLAGNYPFLYGGDESDRSLSGRTILISVRNNTGLTLGPGVVPGSEQIFINGYETGSAKVDYNSGDITFNRYIYPSDRIEVIYRTETTDLSGGDLLVAQGNKFYPSENLQFHLAEMFRWNISKSSSTTGESSSPGGLTVAGGMLYNNDNLTMELTAAGGFTTPDTTGYLKLLGMEESGFDFSIGSSLIAPSTDTVWDGTTSLPESERDPLIYTDFYSTDGLGYYFLNNYNWPSAVTDTSKEGPSIAGRLSSDSSFSGNVLVLDYNLGDGNWSAGDLLLSSDGPIDLSHYTELSLYLKKQNSQGDISLKILMGENGESEDLDGDGFTEDYDSSLIVDMGTATLSAADDQWTEFTYRLTPADRKKLTKSRSIRFLIEEDSGTSSTASGRILAGGVHLEGSVFRTTEGDDKVTISETDDSAIIVALDEDFPEVSELFHSSDEEQKVLQISWQGLGGSESWAAETHTSPVSEDSYSTFSFYIYNDTASLNGNYDFALTDSADRGYAFSYTPETTGWKKISLSLNEQTLSVNGVETATQVVTDSERGELSRFAISGSGATAGTVYLDELHYSDPTFSLKGDVEFNTAYSRPGLIASTAGGFPLLADFTLNNQLSYSGSTVLTEQAEGFNALENYTSLGITMLLLSLEGTMKVNWNQETTDLSGSHKLELPKGFPYVSFTDSYSRSGSGESSSGSRGNGLLFTIPGQGSIDLTTGADGSGDDLVQSWSFDTEWNLGERNKISTKAGLEQNALWDGRDRGNYFRNWLYDYELIAPEKESVSSRSFNSSLNYSLSPEPVGLTVAPSLSFTTESSPTSQHNTKGGLILSLPIQFYDREEDTWKITPAYSRIFTEKRATSDTDSFRDGFNNMFSDLQNWIPLTSFIPFHELIDSSAMNRFAEETDFLDQAGYTPEFSLELNRKYGSEIYDIFMPYSFESTYSRLFSKEDDSYSGEKNLSFTFKQSAVNLFGRFGVYETFDFYDSEDISSSLQFSFAGTETEALAPEELVYQNYFSFYGQNNSVLSLENKVETSFTETYIRDTLDIKFLWKRDLRESFSLDFLNRLIEKEHFWSHEEGLQLALIRSEENSVEISGKHQSTLNVPGLGALRGWLTLGFYKEPELTRAGFEAGLELEMSF